MRILLVAVLSCLACAAAFGSTLIYNVNGYTMDRGARMEFVALEYDQGRITRLYFELDDLSISSADERIDGDGATLLPGLIDAHGHVGNHGLLLRSVDLAGVLSEADAVVRVQKYLNTAVEQEWVQGRGWNQVLWDSNAFPLRQSLDALDTNKFIVLRRVDGHAMWVNSATLKRAGIDDKTPNPVGGQIVRDAQGVATGVLIDNAMAHVNKVMPAITDVQMAGLLKEAMIDLASYGLTSVHEAASPAQFVRAFQLLRDAGDMPIRIYSMLSVLDPRNDTYLEQGPIIDSQHMLDIRSVKISADGALGSRGAALFDDYSDAPGHTGLLLLTEKQLEHHIDRAMAAGYQVNTHAIGDLANDRVLDFYERLMKKHSSGSMRHRIEHAQILRPEDIDRLAAAEIIASIQPTHATSDMNMAGDRLGQKRVSSGAYAWKSLLDSGARLAGGSDFPVESPNPFFGLYSAVTRQSHQGQPEGGWLPSEKLSREDALSLFTEGAAFAAHQEHLVGKLLPGYYADFILVKDDYFTQPVASIWSNKVLSTYVAGQRVFQSAQ